ncbi:MAG: hypothetical protein ACR2NM_05940, partial [Bythopirellula sp.]
MPFRRTRCLTLTIALVSLVSLCSLLGLNTFAEPPTVASTEPDARFAKLEKSLSGVVLVGNFTETGGPETTL